LNRLEGITRKRNQGANLSLISHTQTNEIRNLSSSLNVSGGAARQSDFLGLFLTCVLDGAVSGATTLTFAGILAGAGVLLGGLLHICFILLGAVSGASALAGAGILAGARMFLLRLGGVALGARRIGVEWRRVQTPHGATEQARKGRCENQGILSTHDVTFSLCLKRSHLNRDLISGGAQQTRQERAARLSPSMSDSREFPMELWPHHIGAGET
jgi:hypothetical protein